jgi:ribosomal protein L23
MKIRPVVTEKALSDSKEGKYTFWVPASLNKSGIKEGIGKLFDVHVKSVKTANFRARVKKNYMGRKITVSARKKATVTLAEKESIDIFEEKKKKK